MKEKILLKYCSKDSQRKTIMDFINEIETISNVSFTNKNKFEKNQIEDLLNIAIYIFDSHICDEMRVHSGNLPNWTDSAAGYYRSDSQKMALPVELTQKVPELKLRNSVHYIGPYEHIVFYHKLYGGKVIFITKSLAMLLLDNIKPEPICGSPRQEIYKELLRCGVNPLQGFVKKRVGQKNQEIHIKGINSHNSNTEFLNKIKKIEEIYWKLFPCNFSKTYPLSSGTAANECAMLTLSENKKVQKVYIHEYWYYENLPTLKRLFESQITEDFREANIFFINLEPTNYLKLNYKKKISNPNSLIKEIFHLARSNRNKRYFLIIDNTINPFSLVDELNEYIKLPNTTLITTTSLSKYQDGDRKYFFGILNLYREDRAIITGIEKFLSMVNGNLIEEQIRYFPSINYEKMGKRIANIHKKNIIFYQNFNNINWFSTPLTFNTVLYPTTELIDKNPKEIDGFNITLRKFISDAVNNYGSSSVEFGDSFGLKNTRVTVQGNEGSYHLPRISPGFRAKPETIDAFAKYLSKELSKFSLSV